MNRPTLNISEGRNLGMRLSLNISAVPNLGMRLFNIVALIACLITTTGCATSAEILSINEVKPWERGTLAREDMQLVTDAMDQSVDDHIYFSKEASTGGSGIQGGGCGCN